MILFSYALSVIAMLILPVILAILLRRHYRVNWILFVIGTITFLGSQAIHLPLNEWLSSIGVLPDNPQLSGKPLWQSALILGLTAGLCEELARAIGYSVMRWARRFEDSIMLGLGHGGIESMVFGGVFTAASVSSLFYLQGVDLETMNLTTIQLENLTVQLDIFTQSPIYAFAPLLERVFAISTHVLFSVIVLMAFTRRQPLYILLAIMLHALIDSSAVYVAFKFEEIWAIWAAFLIILIPSWIWVVSLWCHRDKQIAESDEKSVHPGSPRVELNFLWSSIRKEFLYQWRTWRMVILCAVLLTFSIASPLLTKFTPQLISSIEEAAMFADLIPEMTLSDSLAQHIETITQFGFIIVILLGMGAVAGEKERRTTGMILSKPSPRWVFLNSKYIAQILVYTLAFAIAMLGGYYYTTLLFGHLDFWVFAAINLLLLLWFMIFAGVTLLGSTIARTTGAAAGISLSIAILLLLAGSLPRISSLMPSGILGWANQLSTQSGSVANWGAVTLGIVIILMCLISAMGIFERQELE